MKTISNEFLQACLELGDFAATYDKLCMLEDPTTNVVLMDAYQPPRRLWDVAKARAEVMPASTQYHGAWPGGFNDHLNDMLLYVAANAELYRSPLSLPQWATVVLLHDWEKLWKYVWAGGKFAYRDGGKSCWPYVITPAFRIGAWLQWSGSVILPDMLNALTMSEGGWSPEARMGRESESSGSAALLHAADMFSAKVRKRSPTKWALSRYPVIENPCMDTHMQMMDRMLTLEKEFPVERVLWPS